MSVTWKNSGIVFLLAAFVIFGLCNSAAAAQKKKKKAKWYDSYDEAMKMAKRDSYLIMVKFTKSGQGGLSEQFDREVFDTEEFYKWSRRNIVLLKAETGYQANATKETARRNRKLADKYGIKEYPTILLLAPDGNEITRFGYIEGGPDVLKEKVEPIVFNHSQFRVVEPYTSIAEAKACAKEKAVPMLLIVADKSLTSLNEKLQGLYKDDGFGILANGCMTVVQVDMPMGKDVKAKNKKAFEELKERHKLGKTKFEMALVDVKKDKILYRSRGQLEDIQAVVSALREAAPPLPYEPGEWLGNFDRAKLIAEQKNKPMLIYFSGTDWCKWCWRLDEQVLDKEEAKSYVKDKFVLLKLDFLRKSPMPTKLAQQNRRVAKRYGHKFFPTLIVTDAQGERLGKTGFIRGGPPAFIEKMEGFLKEAK